MNPKIRSMRCLKCQSLLPVQDYLYGCPHCREKGENSAVIFEYTGEQQILTNKKGFGRYAQFLPYDQLITLGAGNTPVVELKALAKQLGLEALYTKNEFQNPSGSHKDRMNTLFIARALDLGASTVCCASSGNEAVSLALYASAAGLRCVCAVTKEITPIWAAAIRAAGAELVVVDSMDDRAAYLQDKIDNEGWLCATNQLPVPVGSPCFGIQGYKTISYELYEEFAEQIPEYILVPTSRGDMLFGIYAGFADLMAQGFLTQMPKLVAAEPFQRLEKVLQGADHRSVFPGDYTLTPSIGGNTVTYQSQYALEHSGGFALSASQQQALEAVEELARAGMYLEASSAITWACLKEAVLQNKIPQGARVLLIASSHGFKNLPK